MAKTQKEKYFFGYFYHNGDFAEQKWSEHFYIDALCCVAKTVITEEEFQLSLAELVSKYPLSELGRLT